MGVILLPLLLILSGCAEPVTTQECRSGYLVQITKFGNGDTDVSYLRSFGFGQLIKCGGSDDNTQYVK